MNSSKMLYQIFSLKGNNVLTSVSTLSLTFPGNDDSLDDSTQYDDAAARWLRIKLFAFSMALSTLFFLLVCCCIGLELRETQPTPKTLLATPCTSAFFGMQHIGLGTRPRIIEINRRKAILTGLAKTILSPWFRTDDKIESRSNFNLQVSFV